MKNLTWQNPEQLFVAQELINKVKSKCCGIKVNKLKAVVCLNLTQMEKYLAEHLVDCKSIFMRVGKRFIINTGYIYQVNTQKQQLILSDYEHFAFALGISKEALKQMKDLLITKK